MSEPATPAHTPSSMLNVILPTDDQSDGTIHIYFHAVKHMIHQVAASLLGRSPSSVAYDPEGPDDGYLRCHFDRAEYLDVPFNACFPILFIAEAIAEALFSHPEVRARGFYRDGTSTVTTDGHGGVVFYASRSREASGDNPQGGRRVQLEMGNEIANGMAIHIRCEDVVRRMERLVTTLVGRPPTCVQYDPSGSDIGLIRCDFDGAGQTDVAFTVEFDYALIVDSLAERFITHSHIRSQGFRECGSWITTDEDGSFDLAPHRVTSQEDEDCGQ